MNVKSDSGCRDNEDYMKKDLVLEGGSMRGMFNNIAFDGAIGVSAGAAFGCNYKSGQIGCVFRYNTRFCRDKRYSGFRMLLKTGDIFSKEFCYGYSFFKDAQAHRTLCGLVDLLAKLFIL